MLVAQIEAGEGDVKGAFAELANKLAAHAAVEEQLFYPAVMVKETNELLHEAVEEHLAVKRVLADMLMLRVDEPSFKAQLAVLKEEALARPRRAGYVEHSMPEAHRSLRSCHRGQPSPRPAPDHSQERSETFTQPAGAGFTACSGIAPPRPERATPRRPLCTERKEMPQLAPLRQPKPPFPARKLRQPGLESDLDPRPRYLAPAYKAAAKLLDKRALITGGDSGIGRAVAVLFAREGADVAIVYLPQEQLDAEETQRAVESAGRSCLLIPGDLTRPAFCKQAIDRAIRKLGGLDILVSNAAHQNHKTLDKLTPEERSEE